MGELPASMTKLRAVFQTTFTCSSSISLEAIIWHKKEGEWSVFSQRKYLVMKHSNQGY